MTTTAPSGSACKGCLVDVGRMHKPFCQDAVCIHTGRSVGLCRIAHDHGLGQSWWKGLEPKTLFAISAGWFSWYDAERDTWMVDEGTPPREDSLPDTARVLEEAWWSPHDQRWVHGDDVPSRFRARGRGRAVPEQS